MIPYLFQIYGPIYANCYGIAIAIGLFVFTYLINQDNRCAKIISQQLLQDTILWSTLIGVIGGRLLWVATNWPVSFYEILEIWQGGLSVLGAILAILLFLPIYLKIKRVPIWPLLDLVAIYAPLLQAISRLGCLMAGCCYGLPTGTKWGLYYNHPDTAVPLNLQNIALHPTQLYSALSLFVIFLLMHNLISKYFKKPGQLITIYLMLSSVERFIVDFWRADQEFCQSNLVLNLAIHQWICVGIFSCALMVFCYQSKKTKN